MSRTFILSIKEVQIDHLDCFFGRDDELCLVINTHLIIRLRKSVMEMATRSISYKIHIR